MSSSSPSFAIAPSISSSPLPLQKHIQLVSKSASQQLLFKFPDLAEEEEKAEKVGARRRKAKAKGKEQGDRSEDEGEGQVQVQDQDQDHEGVHKMKKRRMSVDFPLVSSCFKASSSSSWKQVELGMDSSSTSTLLSQHSPSHSMAIFEPPSCTPLISSSPSPSPSRSRSRSRSRSQSRSALLSNNGSSSTPLSERSKVPFRRRSRLPSSTTSKMMQKLVKGASKCLNNKYRRRIQLASRRYKLRTTLGPHRELM